MSGIEFLEKYPNLHYKQRLLLDSESQLKHYEFNLALIKYYFDLILKLNAVFFAVAGGLGSFYLLHPEIKEMKLVLQLPLILGLYIAQSLKAIELPFRNLIHEAQLFKHMTSPFEEHFTIIQPEMFIVLSFFLISFCMLGISFVTYGWLGMTIWLIVIIGTFCLSAYSNQLIAKRQAAFMEKCRAEILEFPQQSVQSQVV